MIRIFLTTLVVFMLASCGDSQHKITKQSKVCKDNGWYISFDYHGKVFYWVQRPWYYTYRYDYSLNGYHYYFVEVCVVHGKHRGVKVKQRGGYVKR